MHASLLAMVAPFAAAMLWWLHRRRARHLVSAATRRLRMQVESRVAERERIARALHDTVLQETTGLVLNFQVVINRLPPGSIERQSMQAMLDAADRSLDTARTRAADLRQAADDVAFARPGREPG